MKKHASPGQLLQDGSVSPSRDGVDDGSDFLEAEAVGRIRDASSGKTVGWVYRWNNGQLMNLWIAGPVDDVVFDQD